ncbi:MAG: hypothetical protein ACPG4U_16025, partial [Pseudomonadales bacterium]
MANTPISDIVEIKTGGDFINREQIGPKDETNSRLKLLIDLPAGSVLNEFLYFVITLPTDPVSFRTFNHQLTTADVTSGSIEAFVPTDALTDTAGEYIDGAYKLQLLIINGIGHTTETDGSLSFNLDTTPPDAPVSIAIE